MSLYLEHLNMLPEHGREPMRLWIEHGLLPGSFLTAILENDLMGCYIRADHINTYRVKDYVTYLYNYSPSGCHGSLEEVLTWSKHGGLVGLTKQ